MIKIGTTVLVSKHPYGPDRLFWAPKMGKIIGYPPNPACAQIQLIPSGEIVYCLVDDLIINGLDVILGLIE